MISAFSKVLGDAHLNITDMMNKSKGEYAYTLFDVESRITQDVVEEISKIDGVLKVRVVK